MLDMSNLIPAGSVDQPLWISGGSYTIGQQVISPTDYCAYVRKTNGTGATDPSSDTTNWQPSGARAIKSIQRGVIVVTGASNTATISSVNTNKSTLSFLGSDTNGSATNSVGPGRIELTNSTTVTATGYQSITGISVGYQITETY